MVTSAGAEPARSGDEGHRKPLPAKVADAARALFAEAEAAEAKGDLDAAIEAYRKAFAIAPHADVQFNLGGVLARDGNIRGAAAAYREYLKLAPDAADRAEVEGTIEALETTPGTLEIDSKTTGTIIFVDGKRAGVTPLTVQVTDGEHRLEALTPISYRSMMHRADWARRHGFFVSPPPRVDGNVIVSGHPALGRAKLKVDGADAGRLGQKLELAPGKRTVVVELATCTWTKKLAAPRGDVVLYAYLELAAIPKPDVCPRGTWRVAPLDL